MLSSSHPHTYQEILSQPEVWPEALAVGQASMPRIRALWEGNRPGGLLFIGCGSTYYLSLTAAALARRAGLMASAMPASEVWLLGEEVWPGQNRVWLIAVSRSGETSETLGAVETFRRAGGQVVIAVTCEPESELARRADWALVVPGAREQSIAQTRSFTSMLLLCQLLLAGLAGAGGLAERLRVLPALGRRLLDQYGGLAAALGGDGRVERFFFLGNGPLYGLAQEAMLKMKEMSLSHSEAFHTLEFRHGPKSLVDERALVVGLLSDQTRPQEAAVLAEMRALGGHTLALANEGDAASCGDPEYLICLGSGLRTAERLVLYLPVLQLLAYHRALARGLDPDQPRHLSAAVVL